MEISSPNDSLEYQLLIIDPGFDLWFQTLAKPKEFYTQNYYENWNRLYVAEWNTRYNSGKNTDIIESYVYYSAATDYGLELNYQLYNYFQYLEASVILVLIHRKGK
ncbi:MAG: hypothetical protein JEZ09_14750 [Salinivirgaceae bacterium]|nr:hypothetical protein [Salinivirgaceae bacterium]